MRKSIPHKQAAWIAVEKSGLRVNTRKSSIRPVSSCETVGRHEAACRPGKPCDIGGLRRCSRMSSPCFRPDRVVAHSRSYTRAKRTLCRAECRSRRARRSRLGRRCWCGSTLQERDRIVSALQRAEVGFYFAQVACFVTQLVLPLGEFPLFLRDLFRIR